MNTITVKYYIGFQIEKNGKVIEESCNFCNEDGEIEDYDISIIKEKAERKLEEIQNKADVTQSHGKVPGKITLIQIKTSKN